MKFTKEELLFFNSITKGPIPFGVVLKYPRAADAGDLKNTIIGGLEKKGIIDRQGGITKQGMLPILLWEEYRNCKRHLILNKMLFAVLPNNRVIILIRMAEGEYELMTLQSPAVMLLLMDQCDFLCLGSNEEKYSSEHIPYDMWQKDLETYGENILTFGCFDGTKICQEAVCYWKEKMGYMYDLNKERRQQLQPRQMRIRIMELLSMEGGR